VPRPKDRAPYTTYSNVATILLTPTAKIIRHGRSRKATNGAATSRCSMTNDHSTELTLVERVEAQQAKRVKSTTLAPANQKLSPMLAKVFKQIDELKR